MKNLIFYMSRAHLVLDACNKFFPQIKWKLLTRSIFLETGLPLTFKLRYLIFFTSLEPTWSPIKYLDPDFNFFLKLDNNYL